MAGEVPLTPIQQWFFEQELAGLHHWNQAFLFALVQPLDSGAFQTALAKVIEHHDVFRLRFTRANGAWRQEYAGSAGPAPFEEVDLSATRESDQRGAIERECVKLQASLNLGEGPLLRVAHFDLGNGRPGRILIAVHHLAIDGVSWRSLLEDLEGAYTQIKAGNAVQLPAKTNSWKRWAEARVRTCVFGFNQRGTQFIGAAWWNRPDSTCPPTRTRPAPTLNRQR